MTQSASQQGNIILEPERAFETAAAFDAPKIANIFSKYPWLNELANYFKAMAEEEGFEEADYISNACGLAAGALVLDDQGVVLEVEPVDIMAADTMIDISVKAHDSRVVTPDGAKFGQLIREKCTAYADALEPIDSRVIGDRFIFGAALIFIIADEIQARRAAKIGENN